MHLINFTIDHYIAFIGLIFFISSLIIISKDKQGGVFLGWFLVCIITLYSKSQWCYLLLAIGIALKLKLIDETFLYKLSNLKQAWDGKYKTENKNKKDIKALNAKTVREIKQATIQKNKSINSSDIMKEYKLLENYVIKWFALNLDIFFEANKKVTDKNMTRIYPDGLFENETEISILEVKMGLGGAYNELLKRGLDTLLRTKNFYNSSDKLINLYLAFVLNNNSEVKKIKHYLQKNDCKFNGIYIYFFEKRAHDIEFIEKVDI